MKHTILIALAMFTVGCHYHSNKGGTQQAYSQPGKSWDDFKADVNAVDEMAFIARGLHERGLFDISTPQYEYQMELKDGLKLRGYTRYHTFRVPKDVPITEYMPPSNYLVVYWIDPRDIPDNMPR